MIYCTRCGAQNVDGSRFCNYCASPLDVKASAPPGGAAPPSQQPYAPPQPPFLSPQWARGRRPEEECLGQTRVPGVVILALIIILIGVFAMIQWVWERTYGAASSGLVWAGFAVAVGVLMISVWAFARRAPPR